MGEGMLVKVILKSKIVQEAKLPNLILIILSSIVLC